jgi:hypothetical protein
MDTMSFDLLFIASPSFHHAVANVFVKVVFGKRLWRTGYREDVCE